jgi:hypothetical protein
VGSNKGTNWTRNKPAFIIKIGSSPVIMTVISMLSSCKSRVMCTYQQETKTAERDGPTAGVVSRDSVPGSDVC